MLSFFSLSLSLSFSLSLFLSFALKHACIGLWAWELSSHHISLFFPYSWLRLLLPLQREEKKKRKKRSRDTWSKLYVQVKEPFVVFYTCIKKSGPKQQLTSGFLLLASCCSGAEHRRAGRQTDRQTDRLRQADVRSRRRGVPKPADSGISNAER